MILYPRLPEITKTSLGIKLPTRKVLPTLGEFTDDTKVKNEVSTQDRHTLIVVAQDTKNHLV